MGFPPEFSQATSLGGKLAPAATVMPDSSTNSDRALILAVCRGLKLPAPGSACLEELELYLRQVRSWGSRVDLVAARSAAELVDLSVADAAMVAETEKELGEADDHLLDVGCGGGAPGVPLLSILGQQRSVKATLVEPRTKRTAFLRSLVGRLNWPDVEVIRQRSDVLHDQFCAVSWARATLPSQEWLAEGARLSTEAVWVFLARGEPPELAGWRPVRDFHYRLPLTGAERRALRYVPCS